MLKICARTRGKLDFNGRIFATSKPFSYGAGDGTQLELAVTALAFFNLYRLIALDLILKLNLLKIRMDIPSFKNYK